MTGKHFLCKRTQRTQETATEQKLTTKTVSDIAASLCIIYGYPLSFNAPEEMHSLTISIPYLVQENSIQGNDFVKNV